MFADACTRMQRELSPLPFFGEHGADCAYMPAPPPPPQSPALLENVDVPGSTETRLCPLAVVADEARGSRVADVSAENNVRVDNVPLLGKSIRRYFRNHGAFTGRISAYNKATRKYLIEYEVVRPCLCACAPPARPR